MDIAVIEYKTGLLEDWVHTNFAATDIKDVTLEAGNVIDSVWRPGLFYDTDVTQALQIMDSERRNAEQGILILLQKFDDLLMYIYPDATGLQAYGHKSRELLILACTEVENFWQYYLRKAGVFNDKATTKDYVKLNSKLHLGEFEFKLNTYPSVPSLRPFFNWDPQAPTSSLDWYQAYNRSKHDRDKNFHEATVLNAIKAVVANLILYAVRFGPQLLSNQSNLFCMMYQ